MVWSDFVMPLCGGALIGGAASLLLLFNGRIFGVSGILGGLLFPVRGDIGWRVAAIVGFLTAGFILMNGYSDALAMDANLPSLRYVMAGLLVGLGTQIGNGCTSGHGVCGISRLSLRSILATITFIATGMAMVALLRVMGALT